MYTNFEKYNEQHYGFGYYINNCSTCNQIMTIKTFDRRDNIYTEEELRKKNLKYLIEWIKDNPEKKITIGNKTNATSKKIDKETFEILIKEFPEKSNI